MATIRRQIPKTKNSERGNLKSSITNTEIARNRVNTSWLPHNPTMPHLTGRCIAELEMIEYWANRCALEVIKHNKKGALGNWERYKEFRRSLLDRVDNLIDVKIKWNKSK